MKRRVSNFYSWIKVILIRALSLLIAMNNLTPTGYLDAEIEGDAADRLEMTMPRMAEHCEPS